MQRVLVILAVIALVTASLGVGALAANWPFWRRAWAWHAATGGGWPQQLAGPHARVEGGGGMPLRFAAAAPDLSAAAGAARTQLLLRVRGDQADAWFAPGSDASMPLDGRGLTAALLPPLFMQLAADHPQLLDRPVGAWLEAWRQDQRGALTPRALLALVADGIDSPPAAAPLNPFSARSRLASGPGMQRAALLVFEPEDGADLRAAAAQLLAAIAARAEGQPFAQVLQQRLWSRIAAGDATLMLDRRRGDAAAHCCMRAAAADWLRLALHEAGDAAQPDAGAADATRTLATSGRMLVIGRGAALLWVGEGPPPSRLEMLLKVPSISDAVQ